MSDLDHIRSFVERWQYVSNARQTYTGTYQSQPVTDDRLDLDTGRPNFLTLSNNKGRYFLYDESDPLSPRKWLPEGTEGIDYIFVSDHGRSTAQFSVNRIGSQKRMINGNLRGYHTADKLVVPLSWEDLPSRAYSDKAGYQAYKANNRVKQYTADGGCGGMELLDWYNKHPGSMWAFFSMDAIPSIAVPDHVSNQGYARIHEVIIKDFSYDVKKRSQGWIEYENIYDGGGVLTGRNEFRYGYDTWDVSMTLEEV